MSRSTTRNPAGGTEGLTGSRSHRPIWKDPIGHAAALVALFILSSCEDRTPALTAETDSPLVCPLASPVPTRQPLEYSADAPPTACEPLERALTTLQLTDPVLAGHLDGAPDLFILDGLRPPADFRMSLSVGGATTSVLARVLELDATGDEVRFAFSTDHPRISGGAVTLPRIESDGEFSLNYNAAQVTLDEQASPSTTDTQRTSEQSTLSPTECSSEVTGGELETSARRFDWLFAASSPQGSNLAVFQESAVMAVNSNAAASPPPTFVFYGRSRLLQREVINFSQGRLGETEIEFGASGFRVGSGFC